MPATIRRRAIRAKRREAIEDQDLSTGLEALNGCG
jgi:hypothetical protein